MSRVAPPHSYIDLQDFSSTQHLAEYLQEVNSNDTLFASYFWWREYYSTDHDVTKESWCKICEKLHSPTDKTVQLFNLAKTLDLSKNCKNPPFIQL